MKYLGTLTAGGKRATLVIVVVLLIMTGLGSTLLAGLMERFSPGAGGQAKPTAQSSTALVAASQSKAVSTPAPVDESKLNLLRAKIEDAWNRNDWPQAIEALKSYTSLVPNDAAMRERLYQAHVTYAWFLMANQRLIECRDQFSMALAIKPDGWDAQEGQKLVLELLKTMSPEATVPPATTVPTSGAITPGPSSTPKPTQPAPTSGPTAAQVKPTAPTNIIAYTVQPGDNLFRLALRFNTTIEAIIALNKLPSLQIKAFQVLQIPVGPCPTPCPTTAAPPPPTPCPATATPSPPKCGTAGVRCYVVRRGDNLFRLALHFDVSVALLMQVNGLQTTTIKVGQTLIIP